MKLNIKFSDLKDSPILISVIIIIFIVAILVLSVYLIIDIFEIKDNIAASREEYKKNCEQIVYLQQVRSQYNTLAAEKDLMDEMLPPTEDVYIVMQNFYTLCDKYNIDVVSMETPVTEYVHTAETKITLTVTGTYNNIISFTDYVANLTALHRIEQIVIEDTEESGLKQASIIIVALSIGEPQEEVSN